MPVCANHPEVVTGLDACATCRREFCADCLITLRGQPICAGCKADAVQDIKSGAREGADLAGSGARLGAILIDGVVIWVAMMALIIPVALRNADARSQADSLFIAVTIAALLVPVVYESLMLWKWGQTLGKMALGIKVVRTDESPVTAVQAAGRALSRTVMAVTRILGLIDALMVFSANRRTLHDRLAGTLVVNARRAGRLVRDRTRAGRR